MEEEAPPKNWGKKRLLSSFPERARANIIILIGGEGRFHEVTLLQKNFMP